MTFMMRCLLLTIALVFGAGAATIMQPAAAEAQMARSGPDYEAWQRLADRADRVIDMGRASTAALEALREQLVEWRQTFVAAQNVNSNAINTVTSQLNALGPPPEDGDEPADVARSRAELNERLTQLRAPRRAAELEQSRAEGLIRGIDAIIRERQTEKLFELGPSPINPGNWADGWTALSGTSQRVISETNASWDNTLQREEFKQRSPVAALLLIIGAILIFRGRHWSKRAYNWAMTEDAGPLRWLGAFGLSLGAVFLPFLGVYAIVEAAFATGLVGLRGGQILSSALWPAFAFLLAAWLAARIFPARDARSLPLNLDRGQRYAGRFYGASLALVAALYYFLSGVAETSSWSIAGIHVILFPFMAVAGLLLIALARLLKIHCHNEYRDAGEDTFLSSGAKFLAFALAAVGLVAPLLAAVGYFELATFLLFPTLLSLQILAAIVVLHRLIVEIYVAVTKDREGAVDSLIPIMIGTTLVLLSLPFFALAWGTRPAELRELWEAVMQGFDIAGVKLSPQVLLTFFIVFGIGYTATRLLQGSLRNSILPKTKMDQGGRTAVIAGTGYIGIFITALVAITSAGIDLSSVAIVAGALSVGIGFGLQTIVSNFVSGIILLVERPISEGDWIEVNGVHGTVRSISVRSTRIETFDRSDIIVPNADFITGSVTNYTRTNNIGRLVMKIGVAYGTDTRRVEEILLEIANAHPLALADPAPSVVFQGFGDSSLDFDLRIILRDVSWIMMVKSELNHQIAQRFNQEGIEIPFPQRDLWLRNSQLLSPAGPTDDKPDAGSAPDQPAREADPRTDDHHRAETADADAAGDGGDR